MAILIDAERQEVATALMRLSRTVRGTVTGMVKADVRAAVDAADQWINDNAGSYNTALPTAARTNLTAKQKALLFTHVANKRWGVS